MDATIAADMAAVLADAYETFGEAATYNAMPVTVMPSTLGDRSEQSPSVVFADASIKVRMSEVARPVPGDSVVIAGVAYLVAGEPSGSRFEWTVDLAEDAS